MRLFRSLLTALILSWAVNASAATYYVSNTTGSEANNCTAAQTITTPKLRISSGVACATTAGDIVYVRAGTYTNAADVINSELYTVASGSSGSPITISAYTSETVTIQPPDGSYSIKLTTGAPSWLVIQDFIIDQTNDTSDAECVYLGNGASNNILQRLEVKNCNNFGVVFSSTNGPTANNTFRDGSVHNCGDPAGTTITRGHAFHSLGANDTYENNDVYDNEGYGIDCYDNSGPLKCSNNVIRNNRLWNNGLNHSTAYAISVAWGADVLIYNNVMWGNNSGILLYSSCGNCQAYNNTVVDSVNDGIAMEGYSSAPTVRNNISYSNGGTDIVDRTGTGTPVIDHNWVTADGDPSFVNAAGNNYHIQSGSGAKDTGTTIASVTVDADGDARPQGAAYDIGYDEVFVTPAGAGAGVRFRGR